MEHSGYQYYRQQRPTPPLSSERRWIPKVDSILKFMPSILTIIGIWIGVWQFVTGLDHSNAQEFKRNVWKERNHAYKELGQVIAALVNSTDSLALFNQQTDAFLRLYWGILPLIQDDEVENALVKFNVEISYFQHGESHKDSLRIKGYRVMKTCQQSLNNTWNQPYDE